MKKLFIVFTVVIALCFVSCNKHTEVGTMKWEETGDLHVLHVVEEDPGKAHNSAKEFETVIGNRLKSQYPSRVIDPQVNIQAYVANGKTLFEIRWSCRLVKVPVEQADYYFDRRGTLIMGVTEDDAKKLVEQEIATSKKFEDATKKFQEQFTNIRQQYSRSVTGSEYEKRVWYIQEMFITGSKKGPATK